jgi:hypothetical protein
MCAMVSATALSRMKPISGHRREDVTFGLNVHYEIEGHAQGTGGEVVDHSHTSSAPASITISWLLDAMSPNLGVGSVRAYLPVITRRGREARCGRG